MNIGEFNLLEHNIYRLRAAGIKNFVLSVGYKSQMIRDFFSNGRDHKVSITYVEDPYPLGDAGAIKHSFPLGVDSIIVVNGDELRGGLCLEEMLEQHKSTQALATVSVIELPEIQECGVVEIDRKNKVTKFMMSPTPNQTESRLVVAGVYFLERNVLKYFPKGHSMLKNVLIDLTTSNKFYAFAYQGHYFNVGTPEILEVAKKHLKAI